LATRPGGPWPTGLYLVGPPVRRRLPLVSTTEPKEDTSGDSNLVTVLIGASYGERKEGRKKMTTFLARSLEGMS
jgi:hypothetical protein